MNQDELKIDGKLMIKELSEIILGVGEVSLGGFSFRLRFAIFGGSMANIAVTAKEKDIKRRVLRLNKVIKSMIEEKIEYY